MAKARLKKEDKNKLAVMKILADNARMPVKEIAKKTGLTRQTVSSLIKKMEDEKLVWGHHTIFDVTKPPIDMKLFVMTAKLKCFFGDEIDKIIESQKIFPLRAEKLGVKFYYVSFVHGQIPDTDVVAIFLAKDLETAKRVVSEVFQPFGETVDKVYLSEEILSLRHISQNPNLVEQIQKRFSKK